MLKPIQIWDLDGTVIDSSHRQINKPDGTLDLDNWIENNVPEKILRDSPLPLAKVMRQQILKGAPVMICTSRVMQDADFEWLEKHGLRTRVILHRPQGDFTSDGPYKIAKLTGFLPEQILQRAVMFDDAAKVRAAVRSLGVKVIDPTPLNRKLAR